MKTAHLGYLIHFFGMFAGELAELLVLPAAAYHACRRCRDKVSRCLSIGPMDAVIAGGSVTSTLLGTFAA
jgi:hypothetical protein